ncbi:hypothetical protein V6N11_012354 [Hibiscus sabdariffa]|uniref:Uncharacterized protein n=1 Tax=Hibiscus sabdariffa TaxID=183260 RepID=A0ABR2QB96_9ROSI
MTDIASLMAKLRFTEEDLDSMDTLQFEEDHHVEEFQYDTWLKAESTRPNQDNVKKPKLGIVFTKHTEPTGVREEGILVMRAQNGDRGKGVGSDSSTSKGSKRTHGRKDGEGSHLGTKKAQSIVAIMGN